MNYFHNFVGIPATTMFAGTSFVTTAPTATTELFPMVTPGSMVALDPIYTFSPIVTGKRMSCFLFLKLARD